MECDKCPADAVTHLAYSGLHLCGEHLQRSVESRVRSRVREDALVPADATPEDPVTWLVGLSGGKDSVVLTTVLHETFREDPRIELVALTIHEGIAGYRDASLDACLDLTDELDIAHEVVSYAEEFGLEMDDVAREDPEGMAPCAYCGVFRRDLLSQYAADLDADLLLTGHNLDDEAQTALMNLFSGDVDRMARHWEASLGPLDERGAGEGAKGDSGGDGDPGGPFVPRAKPLRDVPEKEVALYAHLRDLPVHMAECPHASEAYRGEIQEHLLALEADHPGTRHSVMSGYEELARLASAARERGDDEQGECDRCGAPTTRAVCRKCALVASVHEAGAGLADGRPEERPEERDADAD
jgi:uncharacterized protein (TIGR00269 family)